MKIQLRTFLWFVPVCVLVSMAITLATVYLLSMGLGFTFNAQSTMILGLIIASASGTIITAVLLIWYEK